MKDRHILKPSGQWVADGFGDLASKLFVVEQYEEDCLPVDAQLAELGDVVPRRARFFQGLNVERFATFRAGIAVNAAQVIFAVVADQIRLVEAGPEGALITYFCLIGLDWFGHQPPPESNALMLVQYKPPTSAWYIMSDSAYNVGLIRIAYHLRASKVAQTLANSISAKNVMREIESGLVNHVCTTKKLWRDTWRAKGWTQRRAWTAG